MSTEYRRTVKASGPAPVTKPSTEAERAYQREYAEAHRARVKALRDFHNAKRTAYVQSVKLARGCADCGYDADPAALNFHHRDPATKLFTIGNGRKFRHALVVVEIAKCEVLCEPCHKARHAH